MVQGNFILNLLFDCNFQCGVGVQSAHAGSETDTTQRPIRAAIQSAARLFGQASASQGIHSLQILLWIEIIYDSNYFNA